MADLPKRDETHLARRKAPLGGSHGGPSCDSDRRDAILERAPSGVQFVEGV